LLVGFFPSFSIVSPTDDFFFFFSITANLLDLLSSRKRCDTWIEKSCTISERNGLAGAVNVIEPVFVD
jgi:hypothetical protein